MRQAVGSVVPLSLRTFGTKSVVDEVVKQDFFLAGGGERGAAVAAKRGRVAGVRGSQLVYLLYWYKSTNTDAAAEREFARVLAARTPVVRAHLLLLLLLRLSPL